MTFADQTVGEFVESVASKTVTPSGGAVAAVCGATGAALGEMVCNLTVGNDDYADVEAEMIDVRDELTARRVRLLELADEDSSAIDEWLSAFKTPEEEDRADVIETASKRATEVPMETAEACLDVVERATVVTEKGFENAAADGGTGALLAHSALEAAVFTVRVNLELIEDETFTAEMRNRTSETERAGDAALERVKANFVDAV